MKAVVIVPALNEAKVIGEVLEGLPKRLKGISSLSVLVVDDGSSDSTFQVAQKAGALVLRHVVNRGLGAAIKTGLSWARAKNADLAITFDADGQHNPQDLPKIASPILKKEADLVIGSRFREKQNIPLDRLIINWFANLATLIFFGAFSTDSQSGFRAFSKKAMSLIDFKADRMDFSSEILLEANKHNLKVVEVPIKAIYTPYSRAKGQKNTNAIPIFSRFLLKIFR